jgi:hypothetical protein
MVRKNWISLSFIFCIGGVGIWLIYSNFMPENEKKIINIISIYGTLISICGLGITLKQIISVKNISKATQEAINTQKRKSSQIQLITDVPRNIRIMRDVQGYLKRNELDIALMRLRDIKEFIESLKGADWDINHSSYSSHLSKLEIDIRDVDRAICKNEKIEISKIITNLEKFVTVLIGMENNLKQKL